MGSQGGPKLEAMARPRKVTRLVGTSTHEDSVIFSFSAQTRADDNAKYQLSMEDIE